MTIVPLKHIVFVTGLSWSHVRAGIKFSVSLVERFSSAYISIYVFDPLVLQARAYLSAQSSFARVHTRIISCPPISKTDSLLDIVLYMESCFAPWMDQALQQSGFEADGSVVAPPSLIIEDHIMGGISLNWKKGSKGRHISVVSFWAAPAASFIAHIGNAEHGYGGRLLERIGATLESQPLGSQTPIEEIFYRELSNRVICIPGLPPHFEHEQIPQILPPILPLVSALQSRWNHMRDQIDTVILSSTYELESCSPEPVAAEACKNAFTNPVTPFCIGPSVDLPSSIPASHGTSDPVFTFLNEARPHSVVYAAFGTTFFPLPGSQRHLEIIVEEILKQGFKLIFALSSKQAQLSEEFTKSVEDRWPGIALFPGWVDQVGILGHPSIHYFLSHGGWNSATEAIVRGVPMIFWPFAGDQPTNVLQIAHQHDCGFELLQVRSGAARSIAYPKTPIIGTDEAVQEEIKLVLEMTMSGRGRQQRLNMRALGRIMIESLNKGGSGDLAMSRFGKSIGL